MKVVVHVGPHRTATTSIQSLLAASRSVLAEVGVWYPQCHTGATAHHVLAWKVLERDLTALGASNDSRTARETLEEWIAEARSNDCATLLLSSEDFAVLRDFGWHSLRSTCDEATSWKLVATRRDPTEIAESSYSHLLLNGLAQEWNAVFGILAQGSRDFYEYLEKLQRFEAWCDVSTVGYCDDSEVFLRKIVAALVGKRKSKNVLKDHDFPRLNSRLERSKWGTLLEFNRLNTPGFVLDLQTGKFPEGYYGQVLNELPKIAWVAALINAVEEQGEFRPLAS